jgi:hypothetical protein
MSDTRPTIIERLQADTAEWNRIRGGPRDRRRSPMATNLQCTASYLQQLAEDWSRDDLIKLVDYAIAEVDKEAGFILAEEARLLDDPDATPGIEVIP